MAKGFKSGGKDWTPGNGGPGRPRKPPEIRALKLLTTEELQEVVNLILKKNKEGLQEIASDPNETMLRVTYAKAALTAMSKGDLLLLETILNRVVGRVRENVSVAHKFDIEDLVAGSKDDTGPEKN